MKSLHRWILRDNFNDIWHRIISVLTISLIFCGYSAAQPAGVRSATSTIGFYRFNNPPTVTTSNALTVFVNSSVVVDNGITVSDADNTTLLSATFKITGNYFAGEDILSFVAGTGTGNIVSSFNSASGVMNLTSSGASATLAQWQAALRAVSYFNIGNPRNTPLRTISISVNDGVAESSTAQKNIQVTPFNAPPSISGSTAPLFFREGNNVPSQSVLLDSLITITDIDGNSTLSLVITRVTGRDTNGIILFINDGITMGNIMADSQKSPVRLTSSGNTATLAQWQAALRSLRYANNSDTPVESTAVVDFISLDNAGLSIFGPSRILVIFPVNDDPVVTASAGVTAFNKVINSPAIPVVIDPLLAVSDADNPTFAGATVTITGNFKPTEDVLAFAPLPPATGNITSSYNASTGVLTLTSSAPFATVAEWQAALRTVTYSNTAPAPVASTRSVSFVVNDGTVNSAPSIKNLFVTSANILNRSWYVTATGNNANSGSSPAMAWKTMQYANDFPGVNNGDTIFVLAGNYAEYINVTKSLKFFGPNYNVSPNSTPSARLSEAIVNAVSTPASFGATVFDAHTPGTNVEIKGFKLQNGYPLHDGFRPRNPLQNITVNFEKNWVSHGINLYAGTLTQWKSVIIKDNYFEAMDGLSQSSAIRLNDANTPLPALQRPAEMIVTISDNVITGTNFGGILLDNVLSAEVLRNKITNTAHTGILLAGGMGNTTISQNVIQNANTSNVEDAGGIKLHGRSFAGMINIINNIVKNSYNGLAILNNENIAGKNIFVNQNSFDLSNTNEAVYHGGTGNLNAACNWNGSADFSVVSSRIYGPVNFTTFITNGNDENIVEPGFQPASGSCNAPAGCGPVDKIPPVIIARNATLFLNANGQAVVQTGDVVQSITDNCAVNPVNITVTPNVFNCSNISQGSTGSSEHQAYISTTQSGNQNFGGELGLEFKVNAPSGIIIGQLGAFDHQGNGITGTQNGGVRVAIFNKNNRTIVAGLDAVISGNADRYAGNFRLKNIIPVNLPPGDYVIVAKGYNSTELNGNSNILGAPYPQGDASGGAISFLNTTHYGDNNVAGFGFPVNAVNLGTSNAFLAGTFIYSTSAGGGNPVTITATDVNGNTTTATATVIVLDNTGPVIVSKNVSVNLGASGTATIQPVDVILSVRDNCETEASSISIQPNTFNCSNLSSAGGSAISRQAYSSNTNMGNQNFVGELGMDFRVSAQAGILVTQLGAFDHQGNGISGTQNGGIRVAIFNKGTKLIVPGLDAVITGNSDQYSLNYRLRNITPVLLPAGEYVIVAKGYNHTELNGNFFVTGVPYPAGDGGSGAVNFLSTAFWGSNTATGFGFPTQSAGTATTSPFLAGTFVYNTAQPAATSVIISVSDVYGNTTSVTASVTVADPLGVCTPAIQHSTVNTDNAPTFESNKAESQNTNLTTGESLVYPDPTQGPFFVKLHRPKSAQIMVHIFNANGIPIEQRSIKMSGKNEPPVISFNIAKHPAGLYYVKIIDAKEVYTLKIVLQH